MSTDHPEPTQEQFELADACIELGPANTWKAAQLIAARDARRDERLRELAERWRTIANDGTIAEDAADDVLACAADLLALLPPRAGAGSGSQPEPRNEGSNEQGEPE